MGLRSDGSGSSARRRCPAPRAGAAACTLLYAFGAVSACWATPLLSYTFQSRSVAASAQAQDGLGGVDSEMDAAAAPDYLPFSAGVYVDAALGGAASSASAVQTSMLSPDAIHAKGGAFVQSQFQPPAFAEASARSLFDVVFQTDAALPFDFCGEVHAAGGPDNALISLSGPGGVMVMLGGPGFNGDDGICTSGVLAPGQYALLADTGYSGQGAPQYGGAEFTLSLTVIPEPAALALWGLAALARLRRPRRGPGLDRLS